MFSKNLKISLLLIGAVILTLSLSISFQSLLAAWTAPLADPVTCNTGDPGCDEPLNKGSFSQTKGGPLIINMDNLASTGLVTFGKVGIGTTTPDYKLSIHSINSSDDLLKVSTTTNQSIFVIKNNGNVGVGTKDPLSQLTVGGPGTSGAAIYSLGSSYGIYSIVGTGGTAVYGAGGAYGFRGVGTSYGVYGNGGNYGVYGIGTNYDFYGAGPKSYFSGNVGIGIANPTYKLDVQGNTAGANIITTSASATGLRVHTNGASSVALVVENGGASSYAATFTGGNVGVGTTTPTAKLTIGGTPGVDGIMFPDGTLQTTAYINDINDNPRWIVWMDETNDKRTDPSIFTKSSQSVWSSYGELYFFINDFAQYSTLFEMKVYAPVATSITQKLYFLDDAIYCWLNGAMVYSNTNNGRRNDLITWQLVPGINTLQIVINNSGGDRYAAFVSGDFFYRYPTLRYVAP